MSKTGKAKPRGTGYHYLYFHRQPGIGSQPDGWVSRKSWLPAKIKEGCFCFGVVIYAKQLDPELIYRYELKPDSSRPVWSHEIDEKIRQAYQRVYAVCMRANAKGNEYVGFQRLRAGGFRLIATDSDCGGRSSYNSQAFGLPTHDWAVNALYRLQEESFVPRDWPLDEWIDANFP